MKTQTRRFSSELFGTLLVIATFVVGLENVSGQGTVINIYDGITPYTVNQATLNSIVNSIAAGNPSAGAWTYVPDGSSVNVAQVLSHNGVGNVMNYGFSATSLTPFTMGQIQWSNSGPLGNASGTLGSQGLNYTGMGYGIYYGADGIRDTADDVTYTSGNANTLVNAVYLFGMFEAFDTDGSSDNTALQRYAAVCPITKTQIYSVNGCSASTTLTYVVPEPTTTCLCILGLSALAISQRRKIWR